MVETHSLTLKSNGGKLRQLVTECHVSMAFEPRNTSYPPELRSFNALWDTGATGTVITAKIVKECGLKPIGMTQVHGVSGIHTSNTYLINIRLINSVGFASVEVTEGDLGDACDVLIGMDIITMGDFSITNKDNNTVFSFRCPSIGLVDYVEDKKLEVPKIAYTPRKHTTRKKTGKTNYKKK